MTKYLKLISAVLVLPLVGCDLGYIEPIYNLTSCPIQLTSSLSDMSEARGPYPILPGGAASEFGKKPAVYAQIIVTDSKHVEHRYDKDALATLRPSSPTLDRWGYTNEGLAFLSRNPERAKLDQFAKQPCDAGQPVPH
jgi:hypothetical protein